MDTAPPLALLIIVAFCLHEINPAQTPSAIGHRADTFIKPLQSSAQAKAKTSQGSRVAAIIVKIVRLSLPVYIARSGLGVFKARLIRKRWYAARG